MTKCLGENNFWDWQNQILALIHFWTRLVFWNSRTIHPIFMKTFFYMGYYINFTRFTGISDPIVHLFYRGCILLFVRVSRIRQIWMLQTQILITSLNTLIHRQWNFCYVPKLFQFLGGETNSFWMIRKFHESIKKKFHRLWIGTVWSVPKLFQFLSGETNIFWMI